MKIGEVKRINELYNNLVYYENSLMRMKENKDLFVGVRQYGDGYGYRVLLDIDDGLRSVIYEHMEEKAKSIRLELNID